MRRFLHLCLNRTPIIGVLMAALLFRALIPTGFMPMLTNDGTIVMELCSGFTSKSVVVHLDDSAGPSAHAGHAGHVGQMDSHDDGQDSSHGDLFEHAPCGFAVAATSAGPPAVPAAVAPVSPQNPLAEMQTAVRTSPSIHRSQTPRGPPLA
ncbi:MAG: hypothetical protein ABL964_08265 [Steroidobacteraceae bacterium]